jgi:hypothetical protein
MSEHIRTSTALAAAGVALGTGWYTLAETVPARLDAALGAGALLLVLVLLVHRGILTLGSQIAPLGATAAFFLVALVWRDSATLFTLNLAVLFIVLALASPAVRGVRLESVGVLACVRGAVGTAVNALIGAVPLLSEFEWRQLKATGGGQAAWRAGAGAIAALPAIVIFGALFMSADPVFERGVRGIFGVDFGRVAGEGGQLALWTWAAAGLLYAMRGAAAGTTASDAGDRRSGAGIVEVGTALALIDLLFAAFVAVQIRYLFGGSGAVAHVAGMTYAGYARRGFFELVWVAALSLPTLLVADWALGRRGAEAERRFRWLAGAMLALLNVILVSALLRMRLYTSEYGLTELRLYTTAFMGWLVLVFGWFAATVLRGRRERFVLGALGAGLLVVGALNLFDPDALIVRTNVERAVAGRRFDAEYVVRLGADAAPVLLAELGRLTPAERCQARVLLAERWGHSRDAVPSARWNVALARLDRVRRSGRLAAPAACPPGSSTPSRLSRAL